MYKDLCFVLDLIHITIDIAKMGCRPNIHLELNKAFLRKFVQSKMENDNARTSIEVCYDYNFVHIKDHIK
jgi:hypothetical protein